MKRWNSLSFLGESAVTSRSPFPSVSGTPLAQTYISRWADWPKEWGTLPNRSISSIAFCALRFPVGWPRSRSSWDGLRNPTPPSGSTRSKPRPMGATYQRSSGTRYGRSCRIWQCPLLPSSSKNPFGGADPMPPDRDRHSNPDRTSSSPRYLGHRGGISVSPAHRSDHQQERPKHIHFPLDGPPALWVVLRHFGETPWRLRGRWGEAGRGQRKYQAEPSVRLGDKYARPSGVQQAPGGRCVFRRASQGQTRKTHRRKQP